MQLTRLRLRGFRNLLPLDLELGPGITVFHGDNGQGKTNLLEAVYFLATLKSFRGARNAQMVQTGAEASQLDGRLVARGLPRDCSVVLKPKSRSVRLDDKSPRSLRGYFDVIKAVAFVPSDLRLIDGAPDGRRAWLDRAAFTADPAHLDVARRYQAVLKQKNALLRSVHRSRRAPEPAELAPWNAELVRCGVELLGRRMDFLEAFMPVFRGLHEGLTGAAKGKVELRYRGCVGKEARRDRAAMTEELTRRVEAAGDEEARRGFSTVGPHRDDWELHVGGEALRSFGSQGQVRTAALALRVAEVVLAEQRSGATPLFLLDDVSSELDPHRNRRLMERLEELDAQVLVTTTTLENLRVRDGWTTHRVAEGVVEPARSGAERAS